LAVAVLVATGCAGPLRATPVSTPRVDAEPIALAEAAAGEDDSDVSGAPDASSSDASDQQDGVVHIVQPGQTLWRIARAYDVSLDVLAEANGLEDPARVDVGTPVFVPGARATIDVAPYPAPIPGATLKFRPEPAADFLWPVADGAFMRPFGEPRRHRRHAGIDIRGARGQEIVAAREGTVAFSGATRGGYGTMVVLDHGDGVQSLYAHAQAALVRAGDTVQRGQAIALVGRTGNATTEHCHFEIRVENRPVDPLPHFATTIEARR